MLYQMYRTEIKTLCFVSVSFHVYTLYIKFCYVIVYVQRMKSNQFVIWMLSTYFAMRVYVWVRLCFSVEKIRWIPELFVFFLFHSVRFEFPYGLSALILYHLQWRVNVSKSFASHLFAFIMPYVYNRTHVIDIHIQKKQRHTYTVQYLVSKWYSPFFSAVICRGV